MLRALHSLPHPVNTDLSVKPSAMWIAAFVLMYWVFLRHLDRSSTPVLQMGDHQSAIADYTAAIAAEPRSSYAHYNRGITLDRLGDYDGAVADFGSAIALEPHNADFYHNRGFSLRKQVCTLVMEGKIGEAFWAFALAAMCQIALHYWQF